MIRHVVFNVLIHRLEKCELRFFKAVKINHCGEWKKDIVRLINNKQNEIHYK